MCRPRLGWPLAALGVSTGVLLGFAICIILLS